MSTGLDLLGAVAPSLPAVVTSTDSGVPLRVLTTLGWMIAIAAGSYVVLCGVNGALKYIIRRAG